MTAKLVQNVDNVGHRTLSYAFVTCENAPSLESGCDWRKKVEE